MSGRPASRAAVSAYRLGRLTARIRRPSGSQDNVTFRSPSVTPLRRTGCTRLSISIVLRVIPMGARGPSPPLLHVHQLRTGYMSVKSWLQGGAQQDNNSTV